jgi:hypothetical protein
MENKIENPSPHKTKSFKQAVLTFAEKLGRSEEEFKTLKSNSSAFWGVSIVLGLLLLGATLMVYGGQGEIERWNDPDADLVIPKSEWKLLFEESPIECGNNTAGSGCFADPKNSALWSATDTRADKGIYKKIRTQKGKKFWLGTIVPAEKVKLAADRYANKILIGWIGAGYKLWANGVLLEKGHIKKDKIPIVTTIPYSLLSGKSSVHLAIEVDYDTEAQFPLGMNWGSEAFVSAQGKGQLYAKMFFISETLPLISASINIATGILFFFFWFTARYKQEYLWLGSFCLALGINFISQVSFVYKSIGYDNAWGIWLANYFLEGGFALMLGLAYSRSSIKLINYIAIATVSLPILCWGLSDGTATMAAISKYVSTWGVIGCYVLATFIPLLQWHYLNHKTTSQEAQFRKNMLLVFSAGMAMMTISNLLVNLNVFTDHYVVYSRFIHIVVVFLMCLIVLADYKKQIKVSESYRLSKYHAAGRSGQWIKGCHVILDLKKSTEIAKAVVAKTGDLQFYGQLVREWYDQVTTAAIAGGGEVLSEKGDEVLLFFDRGYNKDSLENILSTLIAMEESQRTIEDKFDLPMQIRFRAAAVYGELQACWKGSGSGMRPGWDGQILVEGARQMELERQIPDNKNHSIAVFESKLLTNLSQDHAFEILQSHLSLVDKDSDSWEMAAAKLNINSAKKEKAS